MKQRLYLIAVLVLSVVALPSIACAQQTTLPLPDHIVVVIFENHNYPDLIGSSSAPNFNALATDDHSALFTNYHAIEHPSQPNYFDLYAGCDQGVQDDNLPMNIPYTTVNLGRQLIDAGKTFITYSEGLPSVGYNGVTSGEYARKHNPAANWMGTGTNQIPPTTNQPYTAFPTDYTKLPTVCFVVPNLIDDMHDGTIQQGDTWLAKNMNPFVQWAKTHNSLLICTFDEDELTTGGQILTIFAGQVVKPGQYSEWATHFSVLRTIEDMYGLSHPCNTDTSKTISDCWDLSASVQASSQKASGVVFSCYPNPSSGSITLKFADRSNAKSLQVFDLLGNNVLDRSLHNDSAQEIELKNLPAGKYIVKVSDGNTFSSQSVILK
jgi:acid phosphatase